MNDNAKLNDLAAAEIDALRADGIDLTPAEIVELNALGWLVETPETRRTLARGAPVELGGDYLWPMSLYAQEWFDRVGCRLAGLHDAEYALGYAMARQYDEGEPLKITGREAEKAVRGWARGLKCTLGELHVAVSQVMAQDEEPEQPPDKTGGMGIGDFSAFLASACGATPDFWERRCAASYCHAVLDALVRQNRADDKPSISDPRIQADRALGWAVEKIRQSRKESKADV